MACRHSLALCSRDIGVVCVFERANRIDLILSRTRYDNGESGNARGSPWVSHIAQDAKVGKFGLGPLGFLKVALKHVEEKLVVPNSFQ